MTITLQAVNELIASLESAGDLSIREQKFLKLAKAFKQLAEENVGLRPLIAENWNMRDLLRQLMAERPGGVYFNKWEKLIVGVLNETPATDRIVAGIKADAITASLDACSDYLDTDCVMDRLDISYEEAEKRTSGAIEFHDAMVDFANQLREGADK
ncbi:TPA: hypothetical protein MYJ06_001421 [Klebsiella pneumoniae]|uniref:hypothetical protein n=1 Tax=Klebsiella pneumoniae TaxID=573 RepID=UPI000808CC6D|nr:hypothetical protein [Klebsiella pneumoniae]MEB5571909.1 hypothetical protein [Klebsiella pneumoniae]MEB5601199.1 hypothetical protein [Klebsiella pneumoniae]SBX74278.1 Uncharacterised protein [Klebsiella pneumoniae]HCA8726126.1 hypothetical protein [Klebsiella pneumoniae]HCC6133043.1 hypothetical protein [Klebsiella pneumoniae]